MESPRIKVASAEEEHSYVAQQQCECGGDMRWERSELHHGDAGDLLEFVWTTCLACNKGR